jgi:serine protease AprX
VIAAIQEAIALKSTYNIRVINLSLGRGIFVSYTQDPLCQAVESAWKAGIVVVVAAGNYGRVSVNGSNGFGTITAPGNDPYVITVGAMKSNGSSSPSAETLASYSSKGPTTYDHVVKPDLTAPGNDIVSLAAPGATLEARISSGTGHRQRWQQRLLHPERHEHGNAGRGKRIGALLLQQNSALTPDQVKARLMKTTFTRNFQPPPTLMFRTCRRPSPTSTICSRWVRVARYADRGCQHRSRSAYGGRGAYLHRSFTTRPTERSFPG